MFSSHLQVVKQTIYIRSNFNVTMSSQHNQTRYYLEHRKTSVVFLRIIYVCPVVGLDVLFEHQFQCCLVCFVVNLNTFQFVHMCALCGQHTEHMG